MLDAHVIWDLPDEPDGNVRHIAEHGFTIDDVESVLFGQSSTVPSTSSGAMVTFGYTHSGDYIAVVWEHVDNNPLTMRPITAYRTREPRVRRQRRRK